MRVLAFEDHYDIEALLTAGGVNTDNLTFEQRWNSSDALEHIRRFKPDVLLLDHYMPCLLYTSPSPRDRQKSRMPSSA